MIDAQNPDLLNFDAKVGLGDRLLIDRTGPAGGALIDSPVTPLVIAHAVSVFKDRISRLVHLGESQIFIECVAPPPSLTIFGAGHDVIPLVVFAKQLGWNVTVADGRPAYATNTRFPSADRVVVLPRSCPLRDISIGADSAVVLMTHNYPLDVRLTREILPLQPRYLGVLGPRDRAQRLFAEIGAVPPKSVHAPVGLDIGCDAPSAVALSIVAEIQASLNGRTGGMLKLRRTAIHEGTVEHGSPSMHTPETARPSYCETMVGSYV